jgi:anaerobic ribonucleoside-triphosphate reductase activating protein
MRISGYVEESIVDGTGIRFVIFAQGCKHKCKGCHNPQTHDFNGGYEITIDEILEKIKANPMIDGVTFSGGDPMEQAKEFTILAKEIKKLGLNIWCYTGYTFGHLIRHYTAHNGYMELLNEIDVLVDGKFVESLKDGTLAFRGSSNQMIIDFRAKEQTKGA